jgi:hypothetical protein
MPIFEPRLPCGWLEIRGEPAVSSLRFDTTADDQITMELYPASRMLDIERYALDATKVAYTLIYRLEQTRM